MALLGNQIAGGVIPVTSSAPGTKILQIPDNAAEPCELTIRNKDSTAIVYLKWFTANPGAVSSDDHSIFLNPSEGYTWAKFPRNAWLVGISTVANSKIAMDGNWSTCP